MRDTPYYAAVVGCGRIGLTMEEDPKQIKPATHVGAYLNNHRVNLAALVDINSEKLAHAFKYYPNIPMYFNTREMLRVVNPEIVSVSTPPSQHRYIVELCADSGVKAIICEKPIADTLDDAERMVEYCAQRNCFLFINHLRRFDSLVQDACAGIKSGWIGEPLQATCYYTAGLSNTGTHVVDLLRFFLGEISWVVGVANNRTSHSEGDENVDALIVFDSGVRAVLQSLEVQDYSIFDLRFYGRKGSLVLSRFGYEIERTYLRDRNDVSGYKELDPISRKREGQPRSFMTSMANHVVNCLDGLEPPVSQGVDGLATLQVLLALRNSAFRGGVRVDISSVRVSR